MGVIFPQHNVNAINYDAVKRVTEPTLGGVGQVDGRKYESKDLLIFHIHESFNTV